MREEQSNLRMPSEEIQVWVERYINDPYLKQISLKVFDILSRQVPYIIYSEGMAKIGALNPEKAGVLLTNLKQEREKYIEATYPKELGF